MKTKRVETKVYTEHMYCECGGEFKYNGSGFSVAIYPTMYYHTCNKCKKMVDLNDVYPRLVYEEVEVQE